MNETTKQRMDSSEKEGGTGEKQVEVKGKANAAPRARVSAVSFVVSAAAPVGAEGWFVSLCRGASSLL